MEDQLSQLSALTHLAKSLTATDVKELISFLQPPAGSFEHVSDGLTFLASLHSWEAHRPEFFLQGLRVIRPDLMSTAHKIHWLSASSTHNRLTPIELLVRILKTQIEAQQWMILSTTIPEIKTDSKLESNLNVLLTQGIITRDLQRLVALLRAINRSDIAIEIQQLQPSLREMSDEDFILSLKKEIVTEKKNLELWILALKKYVITQNKNIKQMIDDEDPVNIESVYIPLTIIKQKPHVIKSHEETTYNEIEFLSKISNKEVEIEPVDFKIELEEYDTTSSEVWCLIGNPGYGKTFLCHRTAMRWGRGELEQFSYTICIPCRTPEWHSMESTRIQAGLPINSDFIQQWLSLGMPVGPTWISDLTEHIVNTLGHGLLLILDSMDEYTKEVPFRKTLLHLLLTRDILPQCTILLTSRPGAYTDISSAHNILIDRFYQVLGFSPDNRDWYFRIQLEEDVDKLAEWKRVLYLHDEIEQLSLVPVNASLFATLVRESDHVTAQTLTQLYSQLITYLIRRQLFRMGLKSYAKQKTTPLSQLHPSVGDCLKRIGEIAYQGVAFRLLTSSEKVTLQIGKEEKPCQCLGLVQEHLQKDSMGVVTKVWSFAHLTMQEFIGSFWLSVRSWGDQSLIVRYIVNTDDNFSVFRVILRFLCGLLSQNASHAIFVLFKTMSVSPISIDNMPLKYQLNHDSNVAEYLGWMRFTQKFLSLCEMLTESTLSSKYVSSYYPEFLPPSPSFYFVSSTSPNEWRSFVRSLPFLRFIQLIYFDTDYVTPHQLRLLLTQLKYCSLYYLAVKFTRKNYRYLTAYSEVILEHQLPSYTKISLELQFCFIDTASSDLSPIFQLATSLCLTYNEFSHESLWQIGNQLISNDSLSYFPRDISESGILIPFLSSQLIALTLENISPEIEQRIQTILPQLSNLEEVALSSLGDVYLLLPCISNLSALKYLDLRSYFQPPTSPQLGQHLLQLLRRNQHSLRGLGLSHIHLMGPSGLIESFRYMSNLVEIQLANIDLRHDGVIRLCSVVNKMRSLVYLDLYSVTLYDFGMSVLCKVFLFHSALSRLDIRYCRLNSESCNYLISLIPTLSRMKSLDLRGNFLYEPDPDLVKVLKQITDMCEVTLELDYA